MNKDLENKELQIEETEVLEEDLAKLPDNIKLELYTKYCALINDKFKELGKLPIIVVAVPKFDTYSQKDVAYNINYIVKNVRMQNNRLLAKAVRSSKFAYVADSTPAELNILIDHLCLGDLASGGKRKPRINTDISDVWDYYGISEIRTDWFRALLSKMVNESKQLKPDGRNTAVKAEKKLANYSEDDKAIASNWFLNNIKSINFDVLCGDVSDDKSDQYEDERVDGLVLDSKHPVKLFGEELNDEINKRTLSKQNTFLKTYNPAGIKLDLDQDGPDVITLGKNVTLTWKRVPEHTQKTLYWVVTQLQNTATIRFKTAIGNAPECVVKMVKDAIDEAKRNQEERATENSKIRGDYDASATVISCNQLAAMIVKVLFNGDLNFLANNVHASGQGDDSEAGGLLPNNRVSLSKQEPKHELDLPFDDINAYGEIVQ